MRRSSPFLVTAMLVAVACGSAACAGGTSSSPSSTVRTTTTTYIAPPEVTTQTTVINGISVTVPVDAAGKPILPARDNGTQIILTTKGLLPQDLEACVTVPMTWTNLTSKPVRLWVNETPPPFTAQVIAPARSFTYTPPKNQAFSFVYHTSLGFDGAVEIGQVPGAC